MQKPSSRYNRILPIVHQAYNNQVCWQMVHFPSFIKYNWKEEKYSWSVLRKYHKIKTLKTFTGIFAKFKSIMFYLCASYERKHHDYKLWCLFFNSHMLYEYGNLHKKFSYCQKHHKFSIHSVNTASSVNIFIQYSIIIMAEKHHNLNLFKLHPTEKITWIYPTGCHTG